VTTDWLQDHLEDRDLTILDCQPNVYDYIDQHLPGAIYLNENLFRAPNQGIPAMWVSEKAAQETMRRAGLKQDRPVVVYSGKGSQTAWGDALEHGMVAYSLIRYGMQDVLVLDGGIEKWKAENRRLTKSMPLYKHSRIKASEQEEMFVNYEQVRANKDRDDVVLFDARPRKYYEGQGPWLKPGHIPGSICLPVLELMARENPRMLRSDQELHEIAYKHGLTPAKTIICMCGTGREATLEYLVFHCILGFPKVRLYEGSFTEWVSYPDAPTVTGPNPR
jgi:thiosulfate/3-mercaptopyruvate sulfurtransferase